MTDTSLARGRGSDGGGSNRGGRSRQKGGRAERRRGSSADHIERLVDRLKAVRKSNVQNDHKKVHTMIDREVDIRDSAHRGSGRLLEAKAMNLDMNDKIFMPVAQTLFVGCRFFLPRGTNTPGNRAVDGGGGRSPTVPPGFRSGRPPGVGNASPPCFPSMSARGAGARSDRGRVRGIVGVSGARRCCSEAESKSHGCLIRLLGRLWCFWRVNSRLTIATDGLASNRRLSWWSISAQRSELRFAAFPYSNCRQKPQSRKLALFVPQLLPRFPFSRGKGQYAKPP